MLKIKLTELKSAEEALGRIANSQLEAKSAFKVARILRVLNTESETIEKLRRDLIAKLGIKDDKGNTEVPKEKIPDFIKEYQALLEQEIEIDVALIPWSVVTTIKLTPNETISIEKFVESAPEEK